VPSTAARDEYVRIAGTFAAGRLLKIIAVDTSTDYCSAASWIDGEIDSRGAHAGHSHSELLLGMVDSLLESRKLRARDLDGIAYGIGPGSFTGLRIACGVVQGIAFGADLPVVGVGTLLAMAAGTDAQRVVCALDARMHEIYHAAYEKRGDAWYAIHEPSVCAPDAAPELTGGGWFGCGGGFHTYGAVLAARYGAQLQSVDAARYPHAAQVVSLAAPRFAANDTVTAEHAAPLYLRDKVALRIDERPTR
jgi:tRNA threonylcarbamoyladenosine biosynthesis protein TsaB